MRDKLHEYLLARPEGASPAELLGLVFSHPGGNPELARKLLAELLQNDPRFQWREEAALWHARVLDALAGRIHDTSFVVVDLETTGLETSADGIIEIGAARVTGGRIVAEFSRLLRPSTPVPPYVARLTGLSTEMLADQPRIGEVWPDFLEFLGTDILVAHNAPYDMGYLDAAALAFQGSPLPNHHVCTLKLARRLVPEQSKRGLDALAALFGIPQPDRHRAMGDVRITVEVLFRLFERLAEQGLERVDQLLALQNQARDGKPFHCPLPREKVSALPCEAGIYRLLGAEGQVLYVGKAKNLRQRVSSYLSNSHDRSDKTLELVRNTHDVRVKVLGSELEAALAEAEAIREEKPPYNQLGKHLPRVAFLKLGLADPLPRLQVTARVSSGRAAYIGPWRSREEAERVMKLLTRVYRLRTCVGRLRPDPGFTPCFQGETGECTLPCTGAVSAEQYARQVEACLRAFRGDLAGLRDGLVKIRDEHASAERFESADRLQRDIELLERIGRRQRTLSWVTSEQNFLVLQPAQDRSVVFVYGVVGGRLVGRSRVVHPDELSPLLSSLVEEASGVRRALAPGEVDGTVILAAWLRDRGEQEGCVFPLPDPGPEKKWPATREAEWRAACAALLG